MLYYLVKYLGKPGFRVNFKKIFLHYQEAIPDNKPVILAVNHPTAFLDPVLLGVYLKRPTHFIVRGDIFKGKLILAALAGLKMLPIFRFRDGYANLKNNQATMDTVYKKLQDKHCVMVLAEGETKHEKRLRSIQKGTARMAFGAIEAYGEMDILVIPVGVNYTDSHAFRSFCMIEVGKAIPLSEFMPVYAENPRKAINHLTQRIQKDLRKLVIHIENEEDDQWVNRVLEIKRNDFKHTVFPLKSGDNTLWKSEFERVERMNSFTEEQKNKVQAALEKYDQQLKKYALEDEGVARANAFNLLNTLFLLLGFVPFIVGYILNILPLWFAENTAKKKVKKIEFYSSVRFGAGLVGYPIYWLLFFLIALITGLFSNNYWGLYLVLAMPFFGFFALIYGDIYLRWNRARKFASLPGDAKEQLYESRKRLLNYI